MTPGFHVLVETIPAWPSAARLFAAVWRAVGVACARACRWRRHPGPVPMSPMSAQWLAEHEVASSKRQDGYC